MKGDDEQATASLTPMGDLRRALHMAQDAVSEEPPQIHTGLSSTSLVPAPEIDFEVNDTHNAASEIIEGVIEQACDEAASSRAVVVSC